MPGPKLKVKNKYRDRPGSIMDKIFPLGTGDVTERQIRNLIRGDFKTQAEDKKTYDEQKKKNKLLKIMELSGKFMTKS